LKRRGRGRNTGKGKERKEEGLLELVRRGTLKLMRRGRRNAKVVE
jgi:hypothetical protein